MHRDRRPAGGRAVPERGQEGFKGNGQGGEDEGDEVKKTRISRKTKILKGMFFLVRRARRVAVVVTRERSDI